ncbi:MAG: Gfo/Idh/MocA family protein [Nocardioidaceae bacterium]
MTSPDTIGWGIVATGNIARAFAADLALLPDARVTAVGSRSLGSASAFAAEYAPGATAYASYGEVAHDPDVDIVYVATPHALHHADVLRCFEAGKPVLCEKALTLSARTSAHLVEEARRRGLFFMEAMWMRCNPLVRQIRDLVRAGGLGRVVQVRADLGFAADLPPTHRLVDPALGGSVVLDMGVYPLTFAHLMLGDPSTVHAVAEISDRGIDLNTAFVLGYDDGAVAALSCSTTGWTPCTASIAGDAGRIDVPMRFHCPQRFDLHRGDDTQTYTLDTHGSGYTHEAVEAMRCLRDGLTESPLVPLDDTLAIMRVMDTIRGQLGVRFAEDDLTL